MQSATLIEPVIIIGDGLFSGQPCCLSITPTPASTGLTFLIGETRIAVHPDNYSDSPNCSIMASGGAQVVQTEHLLAALWAAGIDTALIEVQGPETPNYDGSALPLFEAIATGGRELLGDRPPLRLKEELTVGEPPGPSITIKPADFLLVNYRFSHAELGEQEFEATVTREWAEDQLLPARTFITEQEAQQALAAGVLKHQHETAGLVIRDGEPNQPLRFDDEYARHKLLDLIGDLYAIPYELTGIITADRSGHALNRRLAHRLAR